LKAAKDLFKKNDSCVTKYEKRSLLKIIANRAYHSPELSETDEDGSDTAINVYDLSWRSEEVDNLLLLVHFTINLTDFNFLHFS
jgi:hypothetical protein